MTAEFKRTKESPPQGRAWQVPDGAVQNRTSLGLPCARVHGPNVLGALCPKLFRGGTFRAPESRGYPCFGFSGSLKMLAKIDLLSTIKMNVVREWMKYKPSHHTSSPQAQTQGGSAR